MEKHDHYGHRARLRERVRREGLDNFEDYQVLEYALSFVQPYKDTNPLAHKLIKHFGSIRAVLEADEEHLKEIDGMGEVSAHFLTSITKIFNYYEKDKINVTSELLSPTQVYEYAKSLFAGKLVEELYVICITPKSKIVKTERVSQGTIGEAKAELRIISDILSKNKVNNIILAHNHPKGQAVPSINDDDLTKALVAMLSLSNSHLIDHIIVAEDGFYSYFHSGKLQSYLDEAVGFFHNEILQKRANYGDVKYDKK